MNGFTIAYYESPMGMIKVAATTDHISEVAFTDDRLGLEEEGVNHLLIQQCIEELKEYFNGQRVIFSVPVLQQGTIFQSRVWQELLNIDFGKTISYMTLAKKLGDANCIRAAASSNGKNRVAIIVPCHRVIGSNQTLVGYAGGLGRKKWLLEHENKFAHGVQKLF